MLFRHRPTIPAIAAALVSTTGIGINTCTAATDPLACPAPATAGTTATARHILDATGVTGGLVVHLGCDTPAAAALLLALRADNRFLVQGLAADTTAARAAIRAADLDGSVAVRQWPAAGRTLPYADNLVKLLVVDPGAAGALPRAELERVLTPGGILVHLDPQAASRDPQSAAPPWHKPVPAALDDWTHFLYGPSNNAVSHDRAVGPPRRLQWTAGPLWARHHDHLASVSAMVAAGGRVFWIMDEGLTASILTPPRWTVVARDAFSGVLLWKYPLPSWHTHYWPNKSGPANIPRRLVATADRLYVTPGIAAPVTALDAATGEPRQSYGGTDGTEEILVSDGTLLLVVDESPGKVPTARSAYDDLLKMDFDGRKIGWNWQPRKIMAVAAADGKILWEQRSPVAPNSLAADAGRVYWHDGERAVAVRRSDGAAAWRSDPVGDVKAMFTNDAPTLVVAGDTVLLTDKKRAAGLDAATGNLLWQEKHPTSGYQAPADLLVVGGLVWGGETRDLKSSGEFVGRDPRTGAVQRRFAIDTPITWFHRCYRAKATDRFLIPARTGIELVDLAAEHWRPNHWVRGGCIYGVMPANGLIYSVPSACSCFIQARINGFNALAPDPADPAPDRPDPSPRLAAGPAFAWSKGAAEPPQVATAHDWPTYRANPARGGFSPTPVPTALRPRWRTALGGRLSGVTVADGKLLVARIDHRELCALDAADGAVVWRFVADGRIDSPPTLWRGRVLFGGADGNLYCLRAADGALAWRFRAAPADRQIVANNQLESAWPVPGSVLVRDDEVWAVAGRSAFLDGGLRLVRLAAATGALRGETPIADAVPATGDGLQSLVNGLELPVALPDILAADDRQVYLRGQPFAADGSRPTIEPPDYRDQQGDGAHLFSPHGFLDDSWFSRSYWIYGKRYASGAGLFGRVGQMVPAGRIMVGDGTKVYAFGYRPAYYRWVSPVEYHLYCADAAPATVPITVEDGMRNQETIKSHPAWHWSVELPLLVRAMALADTTLFVAGPPDVVDEVDAYHHINDPDRQARLAAQEAAWRGQSGGELWAVAAADGQRLTAVPLDTPPVWDGLAAADRRLFMAATDGTVRCFAGATAND